MKQGPPGGPRKTIGVDDIFDNGSDNDNDEGLEIPRIPRDRTAPKGAVTKGAVRKGEAKDDTPAKKGATALDEGERKKRELITRGKAKGFLTDDEVSAQLPDSIVSSALMDDWLSAFAAEGIEIVGKSAADAEGKKEEDQEQGDADRYSTTVDPVRLYLRQMSSVALLTREGEVAIAKRIEEGERRVLQVVLSSSVAIEEILESGPQAAGADHPGEGDRQGRRRGGPRVRRGVAHRAGLQGHRQGSPALE